jgi:RNA polymerase sigma-70 factor (ECF subfamily)
VAERVERELQRQRARLYGYALSLTGDRDLAQDLLQDCAVKALSTVAIPPDDGAMRAWLFRILRNAWIDRNRSNRLEFMAEPPESTDRSEYWSHNARLISAIAVRQAMARMPVAHRDVIALIDLCGFAYAEAAAILDVPVGTVMSRLSRARRALLEKLADNNVRALRVNRRSE